MGKPLSAAILIDEWKLSFFNKALKAAKYQFTKKKGLVSGTLTLMVTTDDTLKLQKLIEETNTAAQHSRQH